MNIQAGKTRILSKDGSIHVTDEKFNTRSSSFGAFFFFIAIGYLVYASYAADKFWHVVGFTVYGITTVGLFIASGLHHGVDGSEKKEHFYLQLDYLAIFFMIAGTFTPFCVILVRNPLGWKTLAAVWTLSIAGALIKMNFPKFPKWICTALYIVIGWVAILIIEPLYLNLGYGLLWIVAAGAIFMIGAIIFLIEKPNPIPGKFGFHEIWHLFVLSGTACIYMVMWRYILPYS